MTTLGASRITIPTMVDEGMTVMDTKGRIRRAITPAGRVVWEVRRNFLSPAHYVAFTKAEAIRWLSMQDAAG